MRVRSSKRSKEEKQNFSWFLDVGFSTQGETAEDIFLINKLVHKVQEKLTLFCVHETCNREGPAQKNERSFFPKRLFRFDHWRNRPSKPPTNQLRSYRTETPSMRACPAHETIPQLVT